MTVTKIPFKQYSFPELKQVDRAIKAALRSSCSHLQAMVDHILQAPGKRVRPLLVILSAALFGRLSGEHTDDSLIQAGAAVELIHTASLVHDDVIDGSVQRRGNPTLHQKWGCREAVLAGDHLLARAFSLLASLPEKKVLLPLFARSVKLMCEGEIRQLARRFDWRVSEREYFHFNYLKTSQLLEASCEAGGSVARAGSAEIRSLRTYGRSLGQAFQIVDDILDYSGGARALGKPVGSDICQGLVTLPLIYLFRKEKHYLRLLQKVKTRLPEPVLAQLKQDIKRSGALEQSYRKAVECKSAAREALQHLPPGRARHLLGELADSVVERAAGAVYC